MGLFRRNRIRIKLKEPTTVKELIDYVDLLMVMELKRNKQREEKMRKRALEKKKEK